MLLFAGHDSTSSTVCYCFHLLHANPSALARIRAEHDSVLSTDLSAVSASISLTPHLLNQLPYTLAVIRETMRLFPAATGLRQGAPGVDLVDEDGARYPTENTMIWILQNEIHRSPKYWKDPLHPVKGAWRPFEYGSRNCIGQGLVMLEIKAVLALTVREFDIRSMYEELDRQIPGEEVRTVDGERAYQVKEGAAHPADHYPFRVTLRC